MNGADTQIEGIEKHLYLYILEMVQRLFCMLLEKIDTLVWGPWLLILLLGTGIYLMILLKFLPLKRLGAALALAFGGEGKRKSGGQGKRKRDGGGQVSSFASLTTELAATIGTGNIVGVVTAMMLGGPGALFWMVLTSLFGMAVKLVESSLAVKYRGHNEKGEKAGGPMYTCVNGLQNKKLGKVLGLLFAMFAVMASFGMGNMTQSNAIADALRVSFGTDKASTGLFVSILTILVVLGGIGSIAKVTQVLVPFMGGFYLLGTIAVILTHWRNVPGSLVGILLAAFCPQAVSGGILGTITVNAFTSLRWGVSRGIFSNEAGLGAAGITAAAADTEDYVRQGYISMTGVFLDTVVMCSLTGLALAVSGVLGGTSGILSENTGVVSEVSGVLLETSGVEMENGTELILAVFRTTFGKRADGFISISIALFAFATIVGWAYQGERAFEFLMGGRTKFNIWYRFAYGLIAFLGCILSLDTVWTLSDICNGLMAVPNLICVLLLSRGICKEIREWKE